MILNCNLQLYCIYRKHVLCFYQVIETRVKVWENEKCYGNTSRRRVFPQLFRVLPSFHECFSNSIETQRTCFLFLLENTAMQKRKKVCLLLHQQLLHQQLLHQQLLHQQLALVLCFYRVIETQS